MSTRSPLEKVESPEVTFLTSRELVYESTPRSCEALSSALGWAWQWGSLHKTCGLAVQVNTPSSLHSLSKVLLAYCVSRAFQTARLQQ